MAKDKEKKEKKKKDEPDAEAAPAAAEPAAAPAAEAAAPAAAAEPKKKIGNVFALFNQAQITEFKEAFALIDQDRDGIIGAEDLAAIYQQIGREADPKVIKELLAECPDKLNFTHFLTLFGEKLHGTDTEGTLRDAFIMFDEDKKGKLHEEYVKDLFMNVGDQFSKDEIKQVWKEAPIEGGMMDYLKFVQIIKRGKDDE
jgi:Ca2+-binding EF-hand superfamily protein